LHGDGNKIWRKLNLIFEKAVKRYFKNEIEHQYFFSQALLKNESNIPQHRREGLKNQQQDCLWLHLLKKSNRATML